jgi:hypothetical protein
MVPCFTVYCVGCDGNSRLCYESENVTMLCSLIGPYFERNRVAIDPIVNCHVIGSGLGEE